jgi:hypothetical protein
MQELSINKKNALRSNPSLMWIALEILAVSFIVLFQELALIRWFPSKIRVLAYFPNLILISAFLGLGLGSLFSGKKSLIWLWTLKYYTDLYLRDRDEPNCLYRAGGYRASLDAVL